MPERVIKMGKIINGQPEKVRISKAEIRGMVATAIEKALGASPETARRKSDVVRPESPISQAAAAMTPAPSHVPTPEELRAQSIKNGRNPNATGAELIRDFMQAQRGKSPKQ